jgi:hypothetical protein
LLYFCESIGPAASGAVPKLALKRLHHTETARYLENALTVFGVVCRHQVNVHIGAVGGLEIREAQDAAAIPELKDSRRTAGIVKHGVEAARGQRLFRRG